MPKVKLTKCIVESARPGISDVILRDSIVPGFMCKVTPKGRKVFMVQYRTKAGERRKPSLGLFGELTVEQGRKLAQDWLTEVRHGEDPGARKANERKAPTVKDLCQRFIEDYSKAHNKPSTRHSYQRIIDCHVLPSFGRRKAHEITRSDVIALMKRLEKSPSGANHVLTCLRKMFNMAELWGIRPDGSNPCRHVPKFPERGKTRLITDEEVGKLFAYLDRAEIEGLENPTLTLAIRLQFEFAARMSEILLLQWDWIDFGRRRIVWPDSKTGDISKPISEEAYRLLSTAPRHEGSPYVCPSLFNRKHRMTGNAYYSGWRDILNRAGVPHVGTHGIRHRAVTDIANSGIPVKVGMALTAHKTVTMFMRYVHTEDDPVRAAAELVANRRKTVVETRRAVQGGPAIPPPAPSTYRPRQRRSRKRPAPTAASAPTPPARPTKPAPAVRLQGAR
ncbi:tyrosine-type recombinase/integrase [Luteimonas salinilitoris]|uniref:Tyrosine-type recombinase/integrase n=1 Tax=Luteimonas salinilitoris TaxID=3237697 RepID=A0ABV4HV24_9GAMM